MRNKHISVTVNDLNNIKLLNKLGRTEKRKISRKINKKLGKNIINFKKYSFKKGESLSREDRRNLVKNKDLIKEMMKIIYEEICDF